MGRRDLNRVSGRSHRHDRDAEPENEAAHNKLRDCERSGDDYHADDDNDRAPEHGFPAAELVREDGGEGGADHCTAVVKSRLLVLTIGRISGHLGR